jgi:hypothetical protein
MPFVIIDPDAPSGGVELLGWMAHYDDARRREQHVLAARFKVLHSFAARHEEWSSTMRPVDPRLLRMTEAQSNFGMALFERRIRNRFVAADIAWPFICKDVTGAEAASQGSEPLTLAAQYARVQEDCDNVDVDHIRKQIWGPSLPVSALAVGAHLALNENEAMGLRGEAHDIVSNLNDTVRRVLRYAELCEPAIIAHRKINIDGEKLIRFRALERMAA